MEDTIPNWPQRLTREQARTAKEKEKLFTAALKGSSKAAGWRYSRGEIFRQHGDWFVSALPSLLWERGVVVSPTVKPMAVDALFWKIVGLEENERLPLSFRANGAWVLRPPSQRAYIALDESDPEKLAEEVVAWATGHLSAVEARTPADLIAEIERQGAQREHFLALEVCLHLLEDDRKGALGIVQDHKSRGNGGFSTGEKSFFDQAEAWIKTQNGRPLSEPPAAFRPEGLD